jgi:hypothetical protein
MTLWRKFVRWLARKEISAQSYMQGYDRGCKDARLIVAEHLQKYGAAGVDDVIESNRTIH